MVTVRKILFILFIFTQSLIPENKVSAYGSLSDILLIKDDYSITPDLIYNDILSLGYNVNVIIPSLITLEIVNNHRLVILCTGSNNNACANIYMRSILETFLDNEDSKLIIEGGENGYVASVYPQYPGFRNKVLKILSCTTHYGGNLLISDDHLASNLATVPNILPNQIQITFSQNSDQDVCRNNQSSELFYKTTIYENNIGVLVAPTVNNPQIINYSFNYSAVTFRSDVKNLLANSIYNLIGYSVSINNISQQIPSEFQLHQNYPNPFNPTTTIKFDIAKSSFIRLSVYDITGKELDVLVDGKINEGSYEVKWPASTGGNGNDYSSGVYFYKLVSFPIQVGEANSIRTDGIKNFIETKKMILIK